MKTLSLSPNRCRKPLFYLNLQLGTSGFGSAVVVAAIVPKIKQKLEPFDEFTLTGLKESPLFSNPSPTGNSDSGSGLGLPAPTEPPSAKRSSHSSEEANVYSEFNWISEVFCATFVEKMQRFCDVDVVEGPNSRAIIPVNDEAQLSNVVISKKHSTVLVVRAGKSHGS
nr:histone-lysine N-methyltransferase family member SUVH9-like [Ipomoea batatas]